MNKREFLKRSAILGAGTVLVPSIASSSMNSSASGGAHISSGANVSGRANVPGGATASLVSVAGDGKFVQPALGYAFDALEPHIDAMTMEIHYGKHHAAYTQKFNEALEHEDMHPTDIYKIFAGMSGFGAGVRNNGGGYFNHNLYWKFMSPDGGGEPAGKLATAINETFGSFTKFRDLFSATALSHFGSGWGWLILDRDGKLQVTSTPNQDNPLMDVAEVQGTPLLNIDVWEHAYYLKYQNMRKNYIEEYLNVVDWNFVGALFAEATV